MQPLPIGRLKFTIKLALVNLNKLDVNEVMIIIIILGEPRFYNDNCIKIIYVNFIKKINIML
jgi:hypothetical protein